MRCIFRIDKDEPFFIYTVIKSHFRDYSISSMSLPKTYLISLFVLQDVDHIFYP